MFFGKIIRTTDLVTFEGNSVDELKKAFTEASEDYLVMCNETLHNWLYLIEAVHNSGPMSEIKVSR